MSRNFGSLGISGIGGPRVAGGSAGRRAPAKLSWPLRQIRLDLGVRPFLPLRTEGDTVWGWVFPDGRIDQFDSRLRTAGIQAEDRTRPCYLQVALADLL